MQPVSPGQRRIACSSSEKSFSQCAETTLRSEEPALCRTRCIAHCASASPKDQIHEEQRGILVIDIYAKERDDRRHQHEQDEDARYFSNGGIGFMVNTRASQGRFSMHISRTTQPLQKPLILQQSSAKPPQQISHCHAGAAY